MDSSHRARSIGATYSSVQPVGAVVSERDAIYDPRRSVSSLTARSVFSCVVHSGNETSKHRFRAISGGSAIDDRVRDREADAGGWDIEHDVTLCVTLTHGMS